MNNKIDCMEAVTRYESIQKRLRRMKIALDIFGIIFAVALGGLMLTLAIYDSTGRDCSNLIMGFVAAFPAGIVCWITSDAIEECFRYNRKQMCKECGHIHKENPDDNKKILNGYALCPVCNKITKHKTIRDKENTAVKTEAES